MNNSELIKYWNVYKSWLNNKLPQYYGLLNEPANQEQLAKLKSSFDFELPDDLLALYSNNNGDSLNESDYFCGSFMAFEFLSIERLIDEYKGWLKLHEEMNWENGYYGSSFPESHIKVMYTNPLWIPLFIDASGNCIGIDYDPDIKGTKGQIINFGRDEDDKFVIAKNMTDFFKLIVAEIDNGNCDRAIAEEDDGGFSYGLRPHSHLIDDLKKMLKK